MLVMGNNMRTPEANMIAPKAIRRGFLSGRDWDNFAANTAVDAWTASAMDSGPIARDGGCGSTPARDSCDQGVDPCSDSLPNQLQAIRRRLWILSATLESLPAKIELACRQSGVRDGGEGLDRPAQTRDRYGDQRLAFKRFGFWSRWRAMRKLARLRLRADRAERRAAVAINGASAAFGVAFEAALQAALARVKADEARRSCCHTPSSRRSG
jgi:hypothetical protein